MSLRKILDKIEEKTFLTVENEKKLDEFREIFEIYLKTCEDDTWTFYGGSKTLQEVHPSQRHPHSSWWDYCTVCLGLSYKIRHRNSGRDIRLAITPYNNGKAKLTIDDQVCGEFNYFEFKPGCFESLIRHNYLAENKE